VVWCIVTVALFAAPLSRLVRRSLDEGYSSHIVLIPLLAGFLIWSKRDRIFANTKYSAKAALAIGTSGIVTTAIAFAVRMRGESDLAQLLIVLSVLLLIVAGFVGFFGTAAFRKAIFPFSLLLMVLPIPRPLIDRVIQLLQAGSADLTTWMFSLLGVPVLREGFVLTMPGLSIEIAKECSGINSSIALLIIMLLVAHETLHSNWRRVALVLIVLPLSIVKNAIRIVTLTMLATHVDPSFLTGRLHHEGGFVFYLISLALVYPVWKVLQKTEKTHGPSSPASQGVLTTS
jgi:exosortase